MDGPVTGLVQSTLMTSMHAQHYATGLDDYLNGIKQAFERLSHELDEAKKQRDEYKELIKEYHATRRIDKGIICPHCTEKSTTTHREPTLSPDSPDSNYFSATEEETRTEGHEHQPNDSGDDEDSGYLSKPVPLPYRTSLSTDTNRCDESGWTIRINNTSEKALDIHVADKWTPLTAVYCVAFSADGQYLAAGGFIELLRLTCIYNVQTGKQIKVLKELYVEDLVWFISSVCFSPDGRYLVDGGSDSSIRVWIISERRIRNVFTGHTGVVCSLSFSPDGRFILSGAHDCTIRIWKMRDGSSRVIPHPTSTFPTAALSLNARYIASANFDKVDIFLTRTGELVETWEGHSDTVRSVVFTPDGKGLLSGSWDKSMKYWDASSLGVPRNAEEENEQGQGRSSQTDGVGKNAMLTFLGHIGVVNVVDISPDGRWVASGSYDSTVRIWNGSDAILHCVLRGEGEVEAVAFSPTGDYLAIGSRGGSVTLCRMK